MSLSRAYVTGRRLFFLFLRPMLFNQISINLDYLLLCLGVILPLELLSNFVPEIPLALVLFHAIEESCIGEGGFSHTPLSLSHISLVPSFQELILGRK